MVISKQIDKVENDYNLDLVIKTDKAPLSIRLFLGIFMIIGFLTPLIVLIFSFYSDLEIGFSYIITLIIGVGVGFYLLRLILWNTYGKEILKITPERVDYHCDYRYFKGNKKILEGSPFRIKPIFGYKAIYGKLNIENDSDSLTTNIDIDKDSIFGLIDILEERLNK